MTALCINENWILSEQHKNFPCPVFGTEYNVTGYADVTDEQDVYGNWVCNGRYGLSAVLDTLAQIHEVTDEDLITTNSKRFSDHYKSRQTCATPATS